MEKPELRHQMIDRLKMLSLQEREPIETKFVQYLTKSDVWKQANIIGITISQGFEWDTEPIIERAWQEGKQICVPKCHAKERELEFYTITGYDQLEVVYNHLQEPVPHKTEKCEKQDIDLLIVPGLLFDRQGYRIGFGGGYYDRFLTDFQNGTLSLAASMQMIDNLPADSFDMPVDDIITEKGFVAEGGY